MSNIALKNCSVNMKKWFLVEKVSKKKVKGVIVQVFDCVSIRFVTFYD